jgi:hypothetical protein
MCQFTAWQLMRWWLRWLPTFSVVLCRVQSSQGLALYAIQRRRAAGRAEHVEHAFLGSWKNALVCPLVLQPQSVAFLLDATAIIHRSSRRLFTPPIHQTTTIYRVCTLLVQNSTCNHGGLTLRCAQQCGGGRAHSQVVFTADGKLASCSSTPPHLQLIYSTYQT